MTYVNWSRWPSTCVEDKLLAYFIPLKDPVDIPVRKEDPSLELWVKSPCVLLYSFQDLRCQRLGSELSNQFLIVDPA